MSLLAAAHALRGQTDPAAPFLLECAAQLPAAGRALDVACGRGRHALLLARAGFEVAALDRDPAAIDALRAKAKDLGLLLHPEVRDLEAPDVDLGESTFDLVVVFRYLHRPLFPALRRALAPGGLLVYETFTRAQAQRGRPRNPEFLLDEGELPRLVSPLEVLRYHEGERDGSCVACVLARRD